MSLLTVVQDVCAVVGVSLPTSIFSGLATNRTMQEMLALANEMAKRIAYDTREWTALKLTATYNGDGVTTAFPLPADYKRMLKTGNVWRSTNNLQPMRFVPDTDEWLNRRARNWTDAWGEWNKDGGMLHVFPVMGTGVTAYHAYLHKNCVALNSGGLGDRFAADLDGYVLDERLLTLGMIWQWKSQKGSPYNEDLGTYQDALSVAEGADSPAPIIIGRKPASAAAVKVAYPWQLPS